MAKAKEQVRAFGYVRLSKYDGESISPTRQRDTIARLAADRGWELVDVFEDLDVSAFKKVKRPGLEAMLGRLDETDAVITYRIDRLARSSRQFGELLETFAASKVQFVATDLHVDDTASGRLIRDMMARLAEFESDNISQRSRAMMAHKRTNGEWVGRIPFGWTVRDKHLVPDKAEQAVLRDAARSYVKGESFVSIARRHGMQSGPLQRILTSERVLTALGRNLAGQLTEVIDRRRMIRTPSSTPSLLSGITRCGVCGGGMVRSSTRGRRGGVLRGQYRCDKAGHVGISQSWLDDHVSDRVIGMVDVAKITEAIRKRRKAGNTPKVAEIEARMSMLDDRYTAGKISEDRYDRMNADLVEQLAAAKAETRRNGGPDLPLELARDLAKRWDTLEVVDRRRIVAAVVERVDVGKANGHGPIVAEDRVRIVWRVQTKTGEVVGS